MNLPSGSTVVPGARPAHDPQVSTDVLIVDDDDDFRSAVRALLSGAGFAIAGEAATGLDAVAGAASIKPSLVLLDVQLPDIDGFEVTRRLISSPLPPAVILISTREAIDYGRRIADCGAIGFITKTRLSGASLHAILRGTGEGVA